jgi:regulator-associated protein of mTOR
MFHGDKYGLSHFDVHPTTCVFVKSSAIIPSRWKTQRVSVFHTDKGEIPLSYSDLVTGLGAYPIRPLPSSSIPRSSSLAFHPTEMSYGVGLPDGSVCVLGCKIDPPELPSGNPFSWPFSLHAFPLHELYFFTLLEI